MAQFETQPQTFRPLYYKLKPTPRKDDYGDLGKYPPPVQMGQISQQNPVAPHFTENLTNTVCFDNQPLRFGAQFIANPLPTVTWMKDNQLLPESNRIKQCIDAQGHIWLNFDRVDVSDAGIYKVILQNPYGRSESAGQVLVYGFQPESLVQRKSFASGTPPQLITPLKSVEVVEGESVILMCTIQSSSLPKVIWMKNRLPLPLSSRVESNFDLKGNIQLRILSVDSRDSGTYTVKCENAFGFVETSCQLSVVSERHGGSQRPRESPYLPKFIKPPQSQLVKEGDFVVLTCEIEAKAKTKVTWLHNNKTLMASSRLNSYFDGRTATLQIANFSDFDVGNYTVIAENNYGSNKFTITVELMPPSQTQRLSISQTSQMRKQQPQPVQQRKLSQKGEIDTAPVIDPQAFVHLEKKSSKGEAAEGGIDESSVINLKEIELLEKRRANKLASLKSKVAEGPEIDETSFVDMKSIQALEDRRTRREKSKTEPESGIDSTPIVDPTAFKYIEKKEMKKADTGPSIDSSPIVDPSSFKYLEIPEPKKTYSGPSIDTTPMIDPAAFRYIEPAAPPKPQKVESTIDTSPIIDSRSFQHLEKVPAKIDKFEGPSIDYTPMVSPEAFKYLEPPKEQSTKSTGPAIDTRSYVNQNAFRYLELPQYVKPEVTAGIDETSYVSRNAFRYIEAPEQKKPEVTGPAIDSRPIISPSAFSALEVKPVKPQPDLGPDIDDRPLIDPAAFISLETSPKKPIQISEKEPETPPILISKISDVYVEEGENAIFTAQLYGKPQPTVIWLKNGKTLDTSSRIFSSYDILSKAAILTIKSVGAEDYGLYELVASNSVGEQRCSARLFIKSSPSIDETNFIPLSQFRDVELKDFQASHITQSGVDSEPIANFEAIEALETSRQKIYQKEKMEQGFRPEVLEQLKDLNLKEGTTAYLRAKFSAQPLPELTWVKDLQSLQFSNRMSAEFDINTSTATLQINSLTASDSGTYMVVASNPYGAVSSQCTLQVEVEPNILDQSIIQTDAINLIDEKTKTVKFDKNFDLDISNEFKRLKPVHFIASTDNKINKPATITRGLTDANVKEGEKFKFVAGVDGIPEPTCTWFHNQKQIMASSRVSFNYDSFNKLAYLEFNDIRAEDVGRYTLNVKNATNFAETSAKLEVTLQPKIDPTPMKSEELFATLEQEPVREDNIIPGVDETSFIKRPAVPESEKTGDTFVAPTFETKLEDLKVKEGENVNFKVKVKGNPFPKVSWYKDGRLCEASSRINVTSDLSESTVSLTITSVNKYDQGTYEAVLWNTKGESRCTCKLMIDVEGRIDESFYIEPSAFKILEKTVVQPEIQPGIDTTAFVSPEQFKYLETPQVVDTSYKEDTSNYRKPTIISPLQQSYSAKENDSIEIICGVDAYPLPKVTWFKDGLPLVASNRIYYEFNLATKQCVLKISSVERIDQGAYTLVIENELGRVTCSTKIEVIKILNIETEPFVPLNAFDSLEKPIEKPTDITSSIDTTAIINPEAFKFLEIPAKKEPEPEKEIFENVVPQITQEIKSIEAVEGAEVTLSVGLIGYPMCEIIWLRNDVILEASSRCDLHYDLLSKVAYLHFSSVRAEDTGTYRVVAQNKLGTCSSIGQLIVIPTKRIEDNAYISLDNIQQLERVPLKPDVGKSGVDSSYYIEPSAFASLEIKKEPAQPLEPEIEYKRPAIMSALTDMSMDEGSSVSLTAIVTGVPIPKLIWKKDGKDLEASSNVFSIYNPHSNEVQLKIIFAQREHSGYYELEAENHLGRASTSCKLSVVESKRIDERPMKPPEAFTGLERSYEKTYTGGIDSTPITTTPDQFKLLEVKHIIPVAFEEDKSKYKAPQILKGLMDGKCNENDNIVLSVNVDGVPIPTFIWFKDDVQIEASSRYISHYDIHTRQLTLIIKNVLARDSGVYRLVALNVNGKAETSAKVFVIPVSGIVTDYFVSPEVFTKLDAAKQEKEVIIPGVDETSKLQDLTKILSLDQKPLKPDNIVPGVDHTSFTKNLAYLASIENKPIVKEEFEADKSNYRAPRIITPFQDEIDINEFEDVTLFATIDAFPLPTLTWMKDSIILDASSRFYLNFDPVTHILLLKISHAIKSDSGVHTITIQNQLGKCTLSAKLRILPTSSIDTTNYIDKAAINRIEVKELPRVEIKPGVDTTAYVDIRAFAPLEKVPEKVEIAPGIDTTGFIDYKLISQLETPVHKVEEEKEPVGSSPTLLSTIKDAKTNEGADAYMIATVDGYPFPKITWLKGNEPLVSSSRLVTNYDILSKASYLLIQKAQLTDNDIYTMVAENEFGRCQCSAQLTVTPTPGIDQNSYIGLSAFENLETKVEKKDEDITPEVDSKAFIDPEKFTALEIKELPQIPEPEVKGTPPSLVENLKDIKANEGEIIVFAATITGTPVPYFVWKKDNKEIVASSNVVPVYEPHLKKAMLKINKVNKSLHEGKYTVNAFNNYGKVESTANLYIEESRKIDDRALIPPEHFEKLEVKIERVEGTSGIDETPLSQDPQKFLRLDAPKIHEMSEIEERLMAPRFITTLAPSLVDAKEYDNIILSVEVEGSPQPSFMWMKDNNNLVSSCRFATHYDKQNKLLSLYIRSLTKQDEGTYYVVAVNPAGTVKSSLSAIKVAADIRIDESSKANLTAIKSLELKPSAPDDVVPGIDKSSMYDISKFASLEHPVTGRTYEGPDIDTQSYIDLSNIKELEAAGWKHTMVEEKKELLRPPVIISPLSSATVNELQTAVLYTTLDAYPLPRFQLFHNNRPLQESSRITIYYDMNSKVLAISILAVKVIDSGTYTLKASNEAGAVETSAVVNVNRDKDIVTDSSFDMKAFSGLEKEIPKVDYTGGVDEKYFVNPSAFASLEVQPARKDIVPGIDTTPMISADAFKQLELPPVPKEPVEDNIKTMEPIISKPLDSIKTTEGKNIVTACIVQGYPRPQFTWYKNGALLPASSRYSSHYDMNTKQLWLYIKSVTVADEGEYTLVAENCAGSCKSSCTLTVNKTETIDASSRFNEDKYKGLEKIPERRIEPVEITPVAPAFFDQNSTTLSMTEGNNLNLTLFVYGYPMPNFEIFHNEMPLLKSNRYFIEYDQNRKCLLIQIHFLRSTDAGNYLCVASNKAGRAEHRFVLNVDTVPSIDYSSGVKNLKELQELEKRLPVTVYAAGIDTGSYVSDLRKFELLEVKPETKPSDGLIKKLVAPVFIETLKDIDVTELGNATLRARINAAHPYPKITWHFNDAEIKYSNRYISNYDLMEGTISLIILACKVDDTGKYRLLVSNEGGSVESACNLHISTTPGIDQTTNRQIDKYYSLEMQRIPTEKEALEFHGTTPDQVKAIEELEESIAHREKQIPDIVVQTIPIQVTTPLYDVTCKEGDWAYFKATLHGKPIPKFVWYKDDKEITSSSRYTSYYDLFTQTIMLRIANVLSSDTGEYRLEASNICGVVSISAKMTVSKVPSIERQPFISSMNEIQKLEMKPVKEDNVIAGISSESHVPMEHFKHVEFKPVIHKEITTGVDTSAFVPTERFEAFEHKPVEKDIILPGIDSTSLISEKTLSFLQQIEAEPHKVEEVTDELVPKLAVLQNIVNTDVIENSTARFSCRVDAYPLPQITWLRNGKALSLSERIYAEYNPYHGIASLTIKNVLKTDEGLYEAVIENAAGSSRLSGTLTVHQTPSIDETSFLSKDTVFYKDEMVNLQCGNPGFLMLPKSTIALVGTTARFDYIPAGNPVPVVEWFKDGTLIREDLRLTFSVNEKGVHSFIIKNVAYSDAGEYSCVVRNESGSATISLKLGVKQFQEKPTFVHELSDLSVRENDSFRLFVETSVDEVQEFVWSKDDTPVGNFYRIETSGRVSSLYIDNAQVKDSGWYSCTVINEAGTSTTRCKIIVMVRATEVEQVKFGPSMLRNPFLGTERKKFKQLPPEVGPPEPRELYRLKPRKEQGKTDFDQSEIAEKLSYMLTPKFTSTLPDTITVEEGQICDIQLTYIPVSDETMRISWYKDGNLVKYGDRFDQTYEKGLARFLIKWIIPEDTGCYEFLAQNRTGSDRVKVNLICKTQRPISYETQLQPKGIKQLEALEERIKTDKKEQFYDASEKKEAAKSATLPQFLINLKDAEAIEGEPVKFAIKVGGNPKPRVVWFVNNKPATTGGRYAESYDGMMNVFMINKTRQFDQGIVKCVAKNKAGQTESTCKLVVKKNLLSPLSYLLLKAGVELQMDSAEFALAEKEMNERLQKKFKSKAIQEEAEKEVKSFINELYEKHKFLMAQRQKTAVPQPPEVHSEPPRFTKSLSTQTGVEGAPLLLEVHYEPKNASVSWFKGLSQLQSSEDFKITTNDSGSSSLNIKQLYANDVGKYSAKITSQLGSSISTAEIIISKGGPTKAAPPSRNPPIFTSAIRNTTIPQKQAVMFGFEVKSEGSQTKITWFRNNQQIESTEELQTIFDGSKGMLFIKEAYLEDSGTYTCRAENEFGIVESIAKLNVQKY